MALCGRFRSPPKKDEDADGHQVLQEFGCQDSDLANALDVALGRVDDPNTAAPLEGNIYRFYAFYRFIKTESKSGQSLATMPKQRFNRRIKDMGLILVFLIQLIAPLGIFATEIRGLIESVKPGEFLTWSAYQWFTVLLAWAFLFCFILKAYNEARTDANTALKTCRLATYLKKKNLPVYQSFLMVDAMVNGYCSILLSMSMFAILYQESQAKDILFDALSLTFVLSIDDIASELGFLGDVWSDEKMGVFYKALDDSGAFQKAGVPSEETEKLVAAAALPRAHSRAVSLDDEYDEEFSHLTCQERMLNKGPQAIYRCTKCVLMVLMVIAIPSPFFFASEAKNWDLNDITNMGKLIEEQQKAIAAQQSSSAADGKKAKKHKNDRRLRLR